MTYRIIIQTFCLSKLDKERSDLINGDTRFYFGSCRMAGEYIAIDKPEIIDQTLSGAYRLVKDSKS